MAYILYSLCLLGLVVGTMLYVARAHWVPQVQQAAADLQGRLPGRGYLYARLPGSGGGGGGSFAADMEAGLSSASFDLAGNVDGGDGRAGLDDAAKREILRVMKKRRLPFDEARRVYMEGRFRANGIGADGRPKDPKFVSFS